MTTNKMPKHDIVITRIVDAPLDMVWKAWTEPVHVMRWWGPQDYTSPSAKIDLREGGRYIFAMQAPENQGGGVHYTAGQYLQIKPLEYLEFTQGLTDADGNPIDPVSVGMPPDFPPQLRTTIQFRALGEMTELVITEYSWTPGTMMVFSFAGMHQSLDKLQAAFRNPR
jgi:uncharacterized protein YndB with AHSA1/START domain